MIDAVKYLAKEHNMSLRGHNTADGKFYNLFALLAKYDVSAAAYFMLLEERGSADKVVRM